jgi:hypothetical protein
MIRLIVKVMDTNDGSIIIQAVTIANKKTTNNELETAKGISDIIEAIIDSVKKEQLSTNPQ